MGNRAIITVKNSPEVGIYLHWNGGPESVLAFLEAAKLLGVRSPGSDADYFRARFTQIVSNYFGGSLCVGVGLAAHQDDGDNGRYVVDGDFKIVKRQRPGAKTVEQLPADQRERYEGILKECLGKNGVAFASAT